MPQSSAIHHLARGLVLTARKDAASANRERAAFEETSKACPPTPGGEKIRPPA
jgi:hypothetical protein